MTQARLVIHGLQSSCVFLARLVHDEFVAALTDVKIKILAGPEASGTNACMKDVANARQLHDLQAGIDVR